MLRKEITIDREEVEERKTDYLVNYIRLNSLRKVCEKIQSVNASFALQGIRKLQRKKNSGTKLAMSLLHKIIDEASKKIFLKKLVILHLTIHKKLMSGNVKVFAEFIHGAILKRKRRCLAAIAFIKNKRKGFMTGLERLAGCFEKKLEKYLRAVQLALLEGYITRYRIENATMRSQNIDCAEKLNSINAVLEDLQDSYSKKVIEVSHKNDLIDSLSDKAEALSQENRRLKSVLMEITSSAKLLKEELNRALDINSELTSKRATFVLHIEELKNKYSGLRHEKKESKRQNNELASELVTLKSSLERSQQIQINLEKELAITSATLKSKENELTRLNAQVNEFKNTIKSLEAEISKLKCSARPGSESKLKVIQSKVEKLFEENENLRKELKYKETQLNESETLLYSAKSSHSSDLEELKNTVHRLNKEKIDFFKEITLLNDKFQACSAEKERLVKISKDFEHKIEEYESQLQKYKELVEHLTLKNSDNSGFCSKEKFANIGHVSFVSTKSDKETFSMLCEDKDILRESTEEILQRVSKIREKYEKKLY